MKLFAIIALTAALTPPATAADKPADEPADACKKRLGEEVRCFIKEARYQHAMCSMQMQLANIGGGQIQDVYNCVSGAQKNMQPYYAAALKKLAKKKDATALLKDTYSYWTATMRGIMPSEGEVRITYARRQSEREQGLDERLQRLELE